MFLNKELSNKANRNLEAIKKQNEEKIKELTLVCGDFYKELSNTDKKTENINGLISDVANFIKK